MNRRSPSVSERREAWQDLVGLTTMAFFVVPPMGAFWFFIARAVASYKPTVWEFLAVFIAWAVIWNSLACFAAIALWLTMMRFVLPARVLRRWAFYGPRVPVLTRLTERLCDHLLGPADPAR